MTILATLAATAHHNDGHMTWDDGTGWMWLWGSLMMLAFVAAVVVGVWLVVRATSHTPPSTGDRERARDILAERYARGELTTDEYRERLDALR